MRRLATFFLLCMTGLLPTSLGGQEDAAKNPWIPTEKRAPGLSRRIFPSNAARTEVGFHVWLPPAYAKEPTRRFPVLYWLHGSGGGIDGVPQLARRFDAAVRAGKIPDLIVVFPWGLPEGMWLDARNGGAPVESAASSANSFPDVDRGFRTIDAPARTPPRGLQHGRLRSRPSRIPTPPPVRRGVDARRRASSPRSSKRGARAPSDATSC
jgi:hypothetical protein